MNNQNRHEVDKVLGTSLCACGLCVTCKNRAIVYYRYLKSEEK